MAFEQKPGFGSLFVNDKNGNDARPDRVGTINFEGIPLEVAGWVRDGKKGQWLSLQVKRKEANANYGKASGKEKQPELPVDDFDQDMKIPF